MEDMKYVMTDETKVVDGVTLSRIKALKNMQQYEDGGYGVKAGDLGGWIAKEGNLSQSGECWISNDACVYGNATIDNDAQICDEAKVYGDAHIFGNARITGHAIVKDDASVYGRAVVMEDAQVMDGADVSDHVTISGQSIVKGDSLVYDRAGIYGNSIVMDNAMVYGDATLNKNAVVGEEMSVHNKCIVSCDLRENRIYSLIAQCGLVPVDGKVTCYKLVSSELKSFYDSTFQYKVGEWMTAKNVNESKNSCGAGLHFSSADYWMLQERSKDGKYHFIIAEVNLDDIITIQEGKIRCRKAFIKGVTEILK